MRLLDGDGTSSNPPGFAFTASTDSGSTYNDIVEARVGQFFNVKNNTPLQVGGDTIAQSVADTGQVQLSSGTAVVDTGISATDATFNLALGVDDPNADTKITGRLFWDDAAGTYKVEIVEDSTSVGNPTVNYDVIRVR
jgi:hypothetical protein